ncbi:hypothetical protein Cgig2_025334 [Carnegiea gigantea]|uniref:Uncharacterized protein n=1 Tax=Carnegiea gigantea TaxID=171969 RepID=A0A9Q1JRW6_9CARY|nr:hypothetical protein Cgig2_025334 [Carnegiea gigantea]
MSTYVLALVGGVRYSAMFTQDEAYVYRGKPYCEHPHPCLCVNEYVPSYIRGWCELTEELREVRDLVFTERTDHHFIQEEDQAMDSKAHDIWLKHSPTRHDKAIIIRRLQASVNKLKGQPVRASHDTNTKLAVTVSCVERRCKAWMITSAIMLATLFTMVVHVIN